MKRPFLVVTYLSGGLWAYIWAESEDQIRTKLSKLADGSDVEVASEPPAWALGSESRLPTFDIDELPDWLLG